MLVLCGYRLKKEFLIMLLIRLFIEVIILYRISLSHQMPAFGFFVQDKVGKNQKIIENFIFNYFYFDWIFVWKSNNSSLNDFILFFFRCIIENEIIFVMFNLSNLSNKKKGGKEKCENRKFMGRSRTLKREIFDWKMFVLEWKRLKLRLKRVF